MFSLIQWEEMVVHIAFLILRKIFPLENALTEIMTLRKFVYLALTQRPLIDIHCNNKDRQILCELNIWMDLYRKKKQIFIYIQLQKIFLFLYNLTIPI